MRGEGSSKVEHIAAYIVFLEGMATFLSPCILPLLPIYISYITGYSVEQLEGDPGIKKCIVLYNALFFVLGFTLVFVVMGITASALGRFLSLNRALLRKISGIVIISMGLYLSGFIKIPFLEAERRFRVRSGGRKAVTSLVMGAAFGFGWTPCIGPILGSVLMLAGASDTLYSGAGLLVIYSLGLGIPFLLAAALINVFMRGFNLISPYLNKIKLASGILLVLMGIMVFIGYSSFGGI